jgi:succinate dehydrogenase / fumarate reductase cytochrome b subunit
MIILGFQQWPIALAYVVANLLLGFHLSHGIPSLFQTLGLNDPKWEPGFRRFGRTAATVIAAGNISIPLAVLFGLIGSSGGH